MLAQISTGTQPILEGPEQEADPFCPSLKNLDLSSNSFKSVPLWLKSACPEVEVLNFCNNSIQFLHDDNFGKCTIDGYYFNYYFYYIFYGHFNFNCS